MSSLQYKDNTAFWITIDIENKLFPFFYSHFFRRQIRDPENATKCKGYPRQNNKRFKHVKVLVIQTFLFNTQELKLVTVLQVNSTVKICFPDYSSVDTFHGNTFDNS